jgi:hypothetical protein
VKKHWRCRIRLHRWERLRNPEGGRYRECRLCEKQASAGGGNLAMPLF